MLDKTFGLSRSLGALFDLGVVGDLPDQQLLGGLRQAMTATSCCSTH